MTGKGDVVVAAAARAGKIFPSSLPKQTANAPLPAPARRWPRSSECCSSFPTALRSASGQNSRWSRAQESTGRRARWQIHSPPVDVQQSSVEQLCRVKRVLHHHLSAPAHWLLGQLQAACCQMVCTTCSSSRMPLTESLVEGVVPSRHGAIRHLNKRTEAQ